MDQNQLNNLKRWFGDYVASFYGQDEYINANIKLKEDHSHRTCDEMQYLTTALGLDENNSRIALAIAILHDIGRFEQFVKYQTYHDPKSTNHALLGLDVIHKTKPLDGLDLHEQQLIETAIKHHGIKELPANLQQDHLLFAKLIRDADKIDIYYVVIEGYKQYARNPNGFRLERELPDEPGYSMELIEAILAGQRFDYHRLRTWNDMKLIQLDWVYDVNFVPTLVRIKQRKLLEQILGFLPKTPDIEKVREKVFQYINQRIENSMPHPTQ